LSAEKLDSRELLLANIKMGSKVTRSQGGVYGTVHYHLNPATNGSTGSAATSSMYLARKRIISQTLQLWRVIKAESCVRGEAAKLRKNVGRVCFFNWSNTNHPSPFQPDCKSIPITTIHRKDTIVSDT
jgi:hypothetical protein